MRHTKPHAEPDERTDTRAHVESNFGPHAEPNSVPDAGPDAKPDPRANGIPNTKSNPCTNSVSDTCANACVSTGLIPCQSRVRRVYCRALQRQPQLRWLRRLRIGAVLNRLRVTVLPLCARPLPCRAGCIIVHAVRRGHISGVDGTHKL